MKKRIFITTAILLSFTMACGNRQRSSLPEESSWGKETVTFRTTDTIKTNTPGQEQTNSSPQMPSVTSSINEDKPPYDNMRGFDPISEDDMDDNGMSRYMENNDEEGWD